MLVNEANNQQNNSFYLPQHWYEDIQLYPGFIGLTLVQAMAWAPFQYPIRRLTVRSREVSKPRDWCLKLSDRSAIWQTPRQHDKNPGPQEQTADGLYTYQICMIYNFYVWCDNLNSSYICTLGLLKFSFNSLTRSAWYWFCATVFEVLAMVATSFCFNASSLSTSSRGHISFLVHPINRWSHNGLWIFRHLGDELCDISNIFIQKFQ